MNERIKELAEQAITDKRTLDEFIAELKLNPNEYYGFKISELEKFAELIVRECAELSANSQYVNNKSEYYEGFNEALIYAGNKIKKHFGVEE